MRALVVAVGLAACGDNGSSAPDARAPATRLAYLNFEGVELLPGGMDAATNHTGIVTAPTTFPPFLETRAAREQVLAGIVDETSELLAPYNIDIVRERPAERYMMIVFSISSSALGMGETNGVAAPTCGVGNGFSSVVTTQYEYSNVAEVSDAQLIHAYAATTVAQIGMAYGVPDVQTPLDCMCWAFAECAEPPFGDQRCTLGAAMQNPSWPCTSATAIDTAEQLAQKLGAHP